MKAYITKYALTSGIVAVDGEQVSNRMLKTRKCVDSLTSYFHKPDWHTTWPEALAQAEIMRDKAVISAQKKLGRLQKLVFEEPQDA